MDVKYGIDMRLWGETTGVEHLPVIESLAGLGYNGVEIPVCGQGNSELKLLRAALEDLGLEVTTGTRLPPSANPVSPVKRSRELALDFLKARLDETALLGSQLLGGCLFQSVGWFSGAPPTDREWEWSRQCLRGAADYAADLGITLALEFQSRFDAYLINTVADAVRMCEDVDRGNLGILYNTFHAHLEEFNPARALPAAGDRLIHIRLSESHRGELGRGQVQWHETFATLAFLDYNGWLVVQALGVDGNPVHPENIWRDSFESRESLSADAIQLLQQIIRVQRY